MLHWFLFWLIQMQCTVFTLDDLGLFSGMVEGIELMLKILYITVQYSTVNYSKVSYATSTVWDSIFFVLGSLLFCLLRIRFQRLFDQILSAFLRDVEAQAAQHTGLNCTSTSTTARLSEVRVSVPVLVMEKQRHYHNINLTFAWSLMIQINLTMAIIILRMHPK